MVVALEEQLAVPREEGLATMVAALVEELAAPGDADHAAPHDEESTTVVVALEE